MERGVQEVYSYVFAVVDRVSECLLLSLDLQPERGKAKMQLGKGSTATLLDVVYCTETQRHTVMKKKLFSPSARSLRTHASILDKSARLCRYKDRDRMKRNETTVLLQPLSTGAAAECRVPTLLLVQQEKEGDDGKVLFASSSSAFLRDACMYVYVCVFHVYVHWARQCPSLPPSLRRFARRALDRPPFPSFSSDPHTQGPDGPRIERAFAVCIQQQQTQRADGGRDGRVATFYVS